MEQTARYSGRSSPLDTAQLATDPRVMDWASLPGARRSLGTNIAETSAVVNTNVLRFKRNTPYSSSMPKDGGGGYSGEVCLHNWVEDRRDRTYKSGEGAAGRRGLPMYCRVPARTTSDRTCKSGEDACHVLPKAVGSR